MSVLLSATYAKSIYYSISVKRDNAMIRNRLEIFHISNFHIDTSQALKHIIPTLDKETNSPSHN